MKPRIAIPVPTSGNAEYNQRNWEAFAHALQGAGGEPVKVALDLKDEALVAQAMLCDSVLLPGSPHDVNPAGYAQPRHPACAEADPLRERVDRALLAHAATRGLPVLGVCFGAQMMNVCAGGTLVQDLPDAVIDHTSAGHPVEILPGSTLAELVDADERAQGSAAGLRVNSSHHQAIDRCGAGLRVVAHSAGDGVVEAVERPGALLWLGVQWHPERTIAASATSRALFSRLVQEAARRAPAGDAR